jgi:RNA polymerase sigma-70 factor, ECF subfamily
MISDKELVDAAVNGDREAFATLVERYERPVRSVAIAVLRNSESVNDVSQDAFLTAYEKLSTLHNRAAFGTWLLKIARRSAYQVTRERVRIREMTAIKEPAETNSDGKLDDRLDKLLQAIVRLPKHEQLVVMLKYFDDESVESVAAITGHTVGTVTKQLTRARNRLKTWLKSKQ